MKYLSILTLAFLLAAVTGCSNWGPMHWGHSTSHDLIHWEHQPIAIYPDENGMIYEQSGYQLLRHRS